MGVNLGNGPNGLIAAVDGNVDHTIESYAANIDTASEDEIILLSRVMVKVYGKKISDGLWMTIGYCGPQSSLDTVVGDTEIKIKGTLDVSLYSRVSLTATGASATLVKAMSSSGVLTGTTSRAITSIGNLGVTNDGLSVLGAVGDGVLTFKRIAAKADGGLASGQSSSGNSVELSLSNSVNGMTKYQDLGNVSGTVSWDADDGNIASLVAVGNITLALITNAVPGTYLLKVVQDGTGSRLLTLDSAYKTPGGTGITLTTTASATDIISIVYDGTSYYAIPSLNFS